MYLLVKNRYASMTELKETYTLDEALKLFALHLMDQDIQNGLAEEARREAERGR